MEKERVIFRKEYDPYRKIWGFLACFPDDEANLGRIQAIPFYKGMYEWESYGLTEVSMEYYYAKKIIHKGTDEASDCLKVLKSFFPDEEFVVCEKIMYKKGD